MLGLNLAAVFTLKIVFDNVVGGFRDVDFAGLASRFEAAGRVHRVAPNIVHGASFAHHARNHRPSVDADSHQPRVATGAGAFLVEGAHSVLQPEGRNHNVERMAVVGHRKAAGAHIGVANGLDFLNEILLQHIVESREQILQSIDERFWLKPLRPLCKILNISKKHRRAGVNTRFCGAVFLQFGHNVRRQHIEQQLVGTFLLNLKLHFGLLHTGNVELEHHIICVVRGVAAASHRNLFPDGLPFGSLRLAHKRACAGLVVNHLPTRPLQIVGERAPDLCHIRAGRESVVAAKGGAHGFQVLVAVENEHYVRIVDGIGHLAEMPVFGLQALQLGQNGVFPPAHFVQKHDADSDNRRHTKTNAYQEAYAIDHKRLILALFSKSLRK